MKFKKKVPISFALCSSVASSWVSVASNLVSVASSLVSVALSLVSDATARASATWARASAAVLLLLLLLGPAPQMHQRSAAG